MKYRLKISDLDYQQLIRSVNQYHPKEGAAFALAGINPTEDYTDVLVRRIIEIPEKDYNIISQYHLNVKPKVINSLISLCEVNQMGAVLCHSHLELSEYSPTDDRGERRIFGTMEDFLESDHPTASLLIYPDGIKGRIWLRDHQLISVEFDEIIVIGESIKRFHNHKLSSPRLNSELLDRQIRAFGEDGQSLISSAKVGIVGVGGIGSSVAEQLTRLGVKNLKIVDMDELEKSNISRVYGSFLNDYREADEYKVNILSKHIRRINPDVMIEEIVGNITKTEIARKLLGRDIIFLCTDNHWSRSIVNEISYQYLIPVINTGMIITSNDGSIENAIGNINILRPDTACLWCSRSISGERISVESMTEDERKGLLQEGYVQDLETPVPSVISINTTVASIAVTQFLQFMTNFRGRNENGVTKFTYNAVDGTIRRGQTNIDPNCICRKIKGFGQLKELNTI